MSEDTKDKTEDNRIPYARFKAQLEARKEAEESRDAYRVQLEQAQEQLKGLDAMTASRAELEAQMSKMRQDVDFERSFMHNGITDAEGIKYGKLAYQMIEGDKPNVAEWLQSDSVPKAVRAYMSTKQEQAQPVAVAQPSAPQTAAPQAPVPQAVMPQANNGTQAQPHYQGQADWKAAAQNPEYYKANKHLFITEDGFLKK